MEARAGARTRERCAWPRSIGQWQRHPSYSPSSQPNFYGFSPPPKPELIAFARTKQPALAVSKGLDRDRAVDESGHQVAILGRLGARPFNRAEMEKMFIGENGKVWMVEDSVNMTNWSPQR